MIILWTILVVFISILIYILLNKTFKKRTLKVIFILFISLILILNVILIKDYINTKSDHNINTWFLFELTRKSMKHFENSSELNISEDIKIFHNIIQDLDFSISLLELNLRNSNFSSESINKDDFYLIIYKLKILLDQIKTEKDITMINQLLKKFNQIEYFLSRVEGGFGKPELMGYTKTFMTFPDDSFDKLKNTILDIENLLSENNK